ncbi:HD domain-containing protein [Fusibacter sp. JL298sf-3]
MGETTSTKYKNLNFYKKLDTQDKSKFDRLVQEYGVKLNNGNLIKRTGYTLHNFDKHCYNIYRVLGNYVVNVEKLNKSELFLLSVAVLFHDVSMAEKIDFTRENHSNESSDYIQAEYDKDAVLKTQGHLTENDVQILCKIVSAHSGENKLDLLNDYDEGGHEEVRTKLLASILRLSDELDVTSNRLGHEHQYKQLEKGNASERESYHHWKKLKYFSGFKGEFCVTIKLNISDRYVKSQLIAGDALNVKSDISEVYIKVCNEMDGFNSIVDEYSSKDGFENPRTFIVPRKIEIGTQDDDIRKIIDEIMNKKNLILANTSSLNNDNPPENTESNVPISSVDEKKLTVPEVIGKLSESIEQWIEEKNAFHQGHFIINDSICSRDWIDTRDLLETVTYSDSIIYELYKHINEVRNPSKETVLIGIDVEGALLASKLALLLDVNFTYVLPKVKSEISDAHDATTELSENSNVIFVTDVISQWRTIREIMEDYKFDYENVDSVYSVLYREPKYINKNFIPSSDELVKKTYVLNSTFKIEVVSKSECERKERCIALNKPQK